MLASGALGCFALNVKQGWHLSMCSLALTVMQGQKKWSHVRSSICSRPKWPTSSWHPLRAVSLCTAGRTSWNRVSWDSLGRVFLYRMPHLSLRWLCSQRSCQSSGRYVGLSWHWPRVPSCSIIITRLKDQICPLSLLPVIYGHASDLQTVLDRVQDAQITAICFDGTHEAYEGSLLHGSHGHCSDLEVSGQGIGHPPGPGHPQQGIGIDIGFPCPIIQLKIVVGQAAHPSVTCSIQLAHCQDIGQGITVCIYIKS